MQAVRGIGVSRATAEAIIHWRASTEREGTPFGNADTHALGFAAAGLVQADVGEGVQVVFYSCRSKPYLQKDVS